MAIEFKLPELGENIASADVLSVLVKTGDKIEKEQGVIEIETDKATIEVPSSVSGTVKEILVKEGEKVNVGQTIILVDDINSSESKETEEINSTRSNEISENSKMSFEEKKSNNVEILEKQSVNKSSVSGIFEMKLPELGENIVEADVLNVLVKEGDFIQKDQGVIEIETDKATIEVPSAFTGRIVEVLVKAGEKAKVGQVLLKIESSEQQVQPELLTAKQAEISVSHEKVVKDELVHPEGRKEILLPGEKDNQPPITKGAAPAAPSVRRIARELGVDINIVPGTGPFGRISMDDVKNFVKRLNEERTVKQSVGVKQEPLPDFSKYGHIEKKPMSNIRTKTAEHMSYSWSSIPHVTQHDKADITELERLRKLFNPKIEKAGGKLTVTSILLKIVASALKVFPQFNSSIDMEKNEIIFKKYYNVGVAVDTEHGLIVPVIKNVDSKNITELSVELNTIAEKARIRKISLEELQGGCITITNLGGIGGTYFTPIVNAPEVSILGVSRGNMEPVYVEGKHGSLAGTFEPRFMLPLSLSYDHRIIDGADAARFLRWICEALEQPMKILIEG